MAKEIQTEVGYLLQLGPNIAKEVYLVPEVKDIDMVKGHVQKGQEIFGAGGYCLSDIRKLKSISREVREYLKGHSTVIAAAILVNSGLSMMVGNLFIDISRPPYLARVFRKESAALKWLEEQGGILYSE
ncbi:hypothetical protein SapgrDRAFT_2649 [Saprospira grandis DSM 2844]|uniref:DUF7793 domain-containing protein n=1 Tax=Saprospira grandis DSM 2844 TaxID=694433 RepID=J1I6A3_9BACT|nr:hypothetical protein [Saprospira grandis]EJF54305.1 hypothetical protein SapgrDRAFT_2649 [Saprospira grandis DSM 2844]